MVEGQRIVAADAQAERQLLPVFPARVQSTTMRFPARKKQKRRVVSRATKMVQQCAICYHPLCKANSCPFAPVSQQLMEDDKLRCEVAKHKDKRRKLLESKQRYTVCRQRVILPKTPSSPVNLAILKMDTNTLRSSSIDDIRLSQASRGQACCSPSCLQSRGALNARTHPSCTFSNGVYMLLLHPVCHMFFHLIFMILVLQPTLRLCRCL